MSIYLDVENSDREAYKILHTQTSAIWNEEFGLYEIDESQFKNFPELKRLKQYNYDQAKARAERIKLATIGNRYTIEEQQEMADRVYLDYVPPKYFNFVTNSPEIFTYDDKVHQYYTSAKIATSNKRFRNRIIETQRPRNMTGLDINNEVPTRGKTMLALALNEKDYAKRQVYIAHALTLCAKERAMGVPGAVSGYKEIFMAFNNAGLKLGYKDRYSKLEGYFASFNAYIQLNKLKPSDPEYISKSTALEKRALSSCFLEASNNVINAVEGNLRNITKITNRGSDFLISQTTKACSDYIHAVALVSNAKLCGADSNSEFMKTPMQLSRKFNNDLSKTITKLKSQIKEDNIAQIERFNKFSSQLKTMSKMSDEFAKEIDKHSEKMIAIHKNSDLDTLNDLFIENLAKADSLIPAFEKHNLTKPRTMGEHEFNSDFKIELSKNQKPLYVVLSYDERQNLSKELKRELKTDPYNGALCVADNAENRIKFAEYLPNDNDIQKMSNYTKELKDDIYKHLTDNGLNLKKEDVIIDSEKHTVGNIIYQISTFNNTPKISIYNKETKEQKEYILGQDSYMKSENFKKDFFKAISSKNAKEWQKRIDTANKISDAFTSDNMLLTTKTNLDFPYLKNSGISAKEFGGYVDNTGVFSGYAFVNDKNATQTSTTIFLPMFNAGGQIINSMAISDNGHEEFIGGAPLKGTFSVPGKYMTSNPKEFSKTLSKAEAILIVHDPASAAAVAKCVDDKTVVVSSNTLDNLKYVAEKLAKQCPNAGIAILAENNAIDAATSKHNAGVYEAEHTARFVLRDLRPLAKAYLPPLNNTELSNGAKTFADAFKIKPDSVRERIAHICAETAENHKISHAVYEYEKKESLTLNQLLHNLNAKQNTENSISAIKNQNHNSVVDTINFSDTKNNESVKNRANNAEKITAAKKSNIKR